MSENELAGVWTLFAMIAFLGVCFWAYSPRRKDKFNEAANLPFADDDLHQESVDASSEQPQSTKPHLRKKDHE